jgi:hypothetical protein
MDRASKKRSDQTKENFNYSRMAHGGENKKLEIPR